MAPVGHSSTHAAQSVQSSALIFAKSFSTWMASTGQTSTHTPHPVQVSTSTIAAMFSILLLKGMVWTDLGSLRTAGTGLGVPHSGESPLEVPADCVGNPFFKRDRRADDTQNPGGVHPKIVLLGEKPSSEGFQPCVDPVGGLGLVGKGRLITRTGWFRIRAVAMGGEGLLLSCLGDSA